MAEAQVLPFGPELTDEQVKHRVLSGNFTLILQGADKSSSSMATLQLQGPIYVDDSAEDVDARLDLYQGRIRRQQVIAMIEQLETMNASEIAALASLAEHISGLAAQVKSGKKLPTTQKMQVENYDAEVTKRKQLIVQRQGEIAAAKKRIGLA